MRCPSLADLPAPPRGKTGWPWTEESLRLPEQTAGAHVWPRITVVTPSFNQGQFIEETIRSILLQGYPDLEYFLLDGGSSDNSVEIIKKYSRWITFWTSERDGGQSAAINRGLKMGSGFLANWINSDDMLCRNALVHLASSRNLQGDTIYIGDCVYIDQTGRVLFRHRGRVHSLEDLLRIPSIWRSGGNIDQPAVLFPLEIARNVGDLNQENHYTMDYELWGKLLLVGAKVQYTENEFGIFRSYDGQKTQDRIRQTDSLLDTASNLISRATDLPLQRREELMRDLEAYRVEYPETSWKHSGRLSRMGLPKSVVVLVRKLKKQVIKH